MGRVSVSILSCRSEDQSNVPSSANKIKLGELLIDAGVITSGDLTEAIQVSRRLGVPIGQALLVSRCVTDNVLEASLEAQALIREGTVARGAAVDALRKSAEDGRALRTFLDIGASSEDTQQTSKRLAELLLDSDIVTQEQIDQALMTSYSSGMPLGSALVLEGVLSPSLFPSILRIQRNIREGRVGREEGISELRSTFLHWIKAEESLARAAEMEDADEIYGQEVEEEFFQQSQPNPHSLDSGMYSRQHSETSNLPQQSGAFAPPSFAPPLYTQPTISAGEGVSRPPDAAPVTPQQTDAPRRQVETVNLNDNAAGNGTPRLLDILKSSGATNHQEVQAAFDRILDDPVASSKLLKLLGVASDEAIKQAIKSHPLAAQIEEQQAAQVVEIDTAGVAETDELADDQSSKTRRPRDRAVLKSTTSKVLGGIVVGAAVAGISSLFKRGKGR